MSWVHKHLIKSGMTACRQGQAAREAAVAHWAAVRKHFKLSSHARLDFMQLALANTILEGAVAVNVVFMWGKHLGSADDGFQLALNGRPQLSREQLRQRVARRRYKALQAKARVMRNHLAAMKRCDPDALRMCDRLLAVHV